MSERGHTSGPWEVVPNSSGGMTLIRGNNVDRRLRHPQTHLQIVPDEDAMLIAASPELLAVAQAVVSWYENSGSTDPDRKSVGSDDLWHMAKKAIAKSKERSR